MKRLIANSSNEIEFLKGIEQDLTQFCNNNDVDVDITPTIEEFEEILEDTDLEKVANRRIASKNASTDLQKIEDKVNELVKLINNASDKKEMREAWLGLKNKIELQLPNYQIDFLLRNGMSYHFPDAFNDITGYKKQGQTQTFKNDLKNQPFTTEAFLNVLKKWVSDSCTVSITKDTDTVKEFCCKIDYGSYYNYRYLRIYFNEFV